MKNYDIEEYQEMKARKQALKNEDRKQNKYKKNANNYLHQYLNNIDYEDGYYELDDEY